MLALHPVRSRYYWRIRAHAHLQRVPPPPQQAPAPAIHFPSTPDIPVRAADDHDVAMETRAVPFDRPLDRKSDATERSPPTVLCRECCVRVNESDLRQHMDMHTAEARTRAKLASSRTTQTESRGWFLDASDWTGQVDPLERLAGRDAPAATSTGDDAFAHVFVEHSRYFQDNVECAMCGEGFRVCFNDTLDEYVWMEACLVPPTDPVQAQCARLKPPETDVVTGRCDPEAEKLYAERVRVEGWLTRLAAVCSARTNGFSAVVGRLVHETCLRQQFGAAAADNPKKL